MEPVTNSVLAFSYNIDYPEKKVYDSVRKEAAADLEKGRAFVSHYLVRIGEDDVKFLWPFAGLPIAAWRIIASIRSRHEQNINAVGNRLVCALVRAIRDEYKSELTSARRILSCVDDRTQGGDYSLSNTIRKGSTYLNENEAFALICGDIPLASLDAMLEDPDISTHHAVVDLNGFENVFKGEELPGCFPRYYHVVIDGVHIKEPNAFLMRRNYRLFAVVDKVFANRKTGRSSGIPSIFLQSLVRHPSIGMPFIALAEWQNFCHLAAEEFRCLNAAMNHEYKHFDWKVANWRTSTASGIATIVVGHPIKIKVEHTDVRRVADIDSIEDLAYMGAAAVRAPEILNHREDAERVRKNVMPALKHLHPLFSDPQKYVNEWCDKVGVPRIFDACGEHRPDVEKLFPQFNLHGDMVGRFIAKCMEKPQAAEENVRNDSCVPLSHAQ